MRRVAIVLLAAAAVCAAAAADTVRSRAEPGWGGYSPVWWPDGSRIVYSRQYQPAKDYPQYHVAFVRPDGSEFRELPRSKRIGDAWDLVPSVSPDGKQMLLTRAAYGPYYNLVVRDVATGAERNLTPKNGEAAGGNWSRDGMRITYSTRGDKIGDEWTPYTARPDGTDARAVAAPSTSVHVWYLPGGNLVVLQRYVRELGSSISVVPAAGGPERTLTPKNQREWSLAGWSPDGSRLLVVRRPDESDVSLWSVPVDGTPMRLLVKGAEDGAWSPDGTRLVYVGGYFTKRRGLFLARADGSGARRVRATGAEPAWAPDGRTIAFSDVGECNESGIFLMPSGGGAARRISDDCRLDGTPRADRILGTSDRDVIRGGGGDDRIDANPGDKGPVYYGAWDYDDVDGGGGNDTILGRRGADTLRGGTGDDRILGGRGADRIDGGPGRDLLDAGMYHDRLYARDGARDTIRCGPGDDRVWADRVDAVASDCEHVYRR